MRKKRQVDVRGTAGLCDLAGLCSSLFRDVIILGGTVTQRAGDLI